ncbi:hypothetical protein [Pseudomonas sp.]|uniref:hypothetical protein n=1 Tax=Pseudomonas sp. TaxID=306 RepID=UPI002ED8E4D8
MSKAIYTPGSGLNKVEDFYHGHYEANRGVTGVLDSVKSQAHNRDILDSANASGSDESVKLPARLEKLFGSVPEELHATVLDSVMAGMKEFEVAHGHLPTADVMDSAIHQGIAAAMNPREILDGVGNSAHSDEGASQPNRIVVAVTQAIAEACPWAVYLPADIGSNESLLGIVSHQAGSTYGGYSSGDLLDGTNSGESYLSSERRMTTTLGADRTTATATFTTDGTTAAPLLRGRTQVFINGLFAGKESIDVSSTVTNSPITGSITMSGVEYTITGTITRSTGALSLAFSSALPVGTVVEAEGFIDLEANTSLTPNLITEVQTYKLYASAWRGLVATTYDTKTQYNNEIGMDLGAESLIAMRNQAANERHYLALRKAMSVAVNNQETFDFDYSTQIAQKTRAQIWQDFATILGICSQTMANDTMDHGGTHLYVPKSIAAQLPSLPTELFVPSGLAPRPSIYRLGRLFNLYEVYYSPKVVSETSTSATILMVGKSSQVARNPIVFGDAVPVTVLRLAFNSDLKEQNALYARNFTQVNPHTPSALGAALITVTNMFASE